DIYREGLVFPEREEEDTVCRFRPDAGKFHESPTGILAGHGRDRGLPALYVGNIAGSTENIRSAVPEPAVRECIVSGTGQGVRFRECVIDPVFKCHLFSELFGDRRDPPADHGDIGVGGADIRHEAFPGRLPDKPQAPEPLYRSMNEWFAVDCRKDRPEIQVKGEIVPDELSRCTLKREMRAILPYPDDVAANDTIPGPIFSAVPAEDLAAG